MCKILIVEDNIAFRKMFIKALTRKFPRIAIQEAGSGRAAFEILSGFQPDIVFMDIRLPGENGLSITRKLKDLLPGIPVIVVTEYDIPEYRSATFQNGADGFIPKTALSDHFSQIEKIIEKTIKKVVKKR